MSDAAAHRPRPRPGPLPGPRPAATSRHAARPDRHGPRRPHRLIVGTLLFAAVAAMIVFDEQLRVVEAKLFTPLVSLVTGSHNAVAGGAIVWFARGTPRAFGLHITAECTTALLLIPLVTIIAGFVVFSPLPLLRLLTALGLGSALLLIVNGIRVAGIAWATWMWGEHPGYEYSHVFVGSAFALLGFVASLGVAAWVLVRARRDRGAGPPT